MEKPLISICIPTYNRADFLRECLESIVTQFEDKHNTNSLSAVIGAIEKYKSDVIFCNTSTFIDDKIISTNNFGVNKNLFLKDKKDLFDFINNHYYCNDFFFTFLSDYIIKRDIFIIQILIFLL